MDIDRRIGRTIALVGILAGFAGTASATPPKLVTQAQIQAVANDAGAWDTLKDRCDEHIDQMIVAGTSDGYAAWDWRNAAMDYSMCYAVAKLKGDAADAARYSKKGVAIMKVLARHSWYLTDGSGAPQRWGTYQFLALGNGSRTAFTLPMTPVGTVSVYLAPLTKYTVTYAGPTVTPAGYAFSPILKISDTDGGPADYVRGVDYKAGWYNELKWLGANHPDPGQTYYAYATRSYSRQSAGYSVSGTALTFTTPPTANQAVFVEYMGPDYEQTGNFMGGVEAIKPDSTYLMRTVCVGLAYAYDLLRESPDLTPALRQEFYTVLNEQIDYYTLSGYESSGDLGNYFVRGYLTGALYTALATDDDNPRAQPGGDLRTLARTLLRRTFNGLNTKVAGGYGPEGSYDSGSNADEFQLFDIWMKQEGEDLLATTPWTANFVRATIHGTKPDRATFYDGGDWSNLPAKPPFAAVAAFLQYQSGHPMAPYARQFMRDGDQAAPGTTADYKTDFPLSYLSAQSRGPLYARSDWGAGALWLSLAVGPVFVQGHEHWDQGHVTLQRGADYLLVNAGGYGIFGALPWHNTLGFDDRGAGGLIVYPNPPSQGVWENPANTKPAKHVDAGTFLYGQVDYTNAYINNSGTNAVKRAVRTVVLIRPDVVVIHDQAQTGQTGVKKYFSMNFGGAISQSGSLFTSTVGQSKVFMRSLVPANPSPTILVKGTVVRTTHGSDYALKGHNYQVMATGQLADTFLHVFQAGPSSQSSMAASALVQTADGRAQGAQVDMGARRWIVLAASTAPQIGATGVLSYTPPLAGPSTHVVGDLPPSTTFQIATDSQSLSAASDANGVMTFSTDVLPVGTVVINVGGGQIDRLPPAKIRGLTIR